MKLSQPLFQRVLLVGLFVAGVAGYGWLRAQKKASSEPLQPVAKVAEAPSAQPTVAEPAVRPQVMRPEVSTPTILMAIERLESQRDAKCHSSACRFEDFLSGTPLTEEGRAERVLRQRQFVRQVWEAASANASDQKLNVVTGAEVASVVDAILQSTEEEDGNLQFTFGSHPPLILTEVRFKQYASIAYSLRAILSVQMDLLVMGDKPLLTLDDSGVDAIRHALDITTVSVLIHADRVARDSNEAVIDREAMSAAWETLLSGLSETKIEQALSTKNAKAKKQQAFDLLTGIVSKKLAAYQAYNDISLYDANALFNNNLVRFYGRYPIANEGPLAGEWTRPFNIAMVDFAQRLLLESEGRAAGAGHALIRTSDAQRAVQELTPNEIDEFEDVHCFHRLPSKDHFHLESYDCDSFRDLGLHWRILHAGLKQTPELSLAADPFAAEILAEAVSQYGVLLCRAAGQHAEQEHAKYLTGIHFRRGHTRLQRLAIEHHSMPERDSAPEGIVSAATDEAETDEGIAYFADVTSDSDFAFLHRSSEWLNKFRRDIPESPPTFSGGGVAAEDINNDGLPDLLFVGGHGNALYLNEANGHFRDISREAGIRFVRPDGNPGEPRQPLIVDLDNDGLRDILITYANDAHRLYRNLDGTHFEDVTATAGLGGEGLIAGPATVCDVDQDGLLDIYIGYFGDYPHGAIPKTNRNNTNALPNRLLRNQGSLQFEDITESSGAGDTGWAQAVSHTDFDRDGRQDLIVANDFGRNAFLRNLGDGKFENVAKMLGLTKAFHSMNVGVCDLNHDDFPDVYISNIATLVKDNKYVNPGEDTPLNFDPDHMATLLYKEYDVLYLSVAKQASLSEYTPSKDFERGPTSTGWAWDAEFFDLDNDSDDDLYVVNGANDYKLFADFYQEKDAAGQVKHLRQDHAQESNIVFVNEGGVFKNRSVGSGADFVGNSRSTAYLDWDLDGDLDVAVNNFHNAATLLRNNAETRGHHWIKVLLVGDPERKTNRDAVGARVTATPRGKAPTTHEVQCGSGYLSMNPKQLHFGLGDSKKVDLRIVWPNGDTQAIDALESDHAYTVHQGKDGAESAERD